MLRGSSNRSISKMVNSNKIFKPRIIFDGNNHLWSALICRFKYCVKNIARVSSVTCQYVICCATSVYFVGIFGNCTLSSSPDLVIDFEIDTDMRCIVCLTAWLTFERKFRESNCCSCKDDVFGLYKVKLFLKPKNSTAQIKS